MKINKSLFISGGILMIAVMGANVLNFLYNVILGRSISATEFGAIILLSNFLYLGSIFYNALASTVNHHIAFLNGNPEHGTPKDFFSYLSKRVIQVNIILVILWIILAPFLSSFFNLGNSIVLYLFTPVLALYPFASIGRGYFQGKLVFAIAAILMIIEPVLKLLSVGILLWFGFHAWAYLSLYISAFLTGLIGVILILKFPFSKESKENKSKFPAKFYFNAVLIGCSTVAFVSLDVVLVKHFLSPQLAGEYALLSLLGKVVYFLGTLLNVFTISLVTTHSQSKKNPLVPFYLLLGGSLLLGLLGVIVFGVFGNIFTPLMLGKRALPILPYANLYLLATLFYTLGGIIITYHLALKQYLFSGLSLGLSSILVFGIIMFHANILQVVQVVLFSSIISFAVILLFHMKKAIFSRAIGIAKLETLEEAI